MRLHPYLLSPEAVEGNTTTTATTATDKAPDLVKAVESLVAKHGDSNAALRVLMSENYTLRDEKRDLKAKLPPDGSLILTGDDAAAWNEYRTLGKPDEIKTVKAEASTAKGELASLKRDASLRDVAEKAGLKFSVLKQIVPPTATLDWAKGKGKDGKDIDVLHVKDGDAEAVPFDERFADFLPALKPETQATARVPGTPPRGQQASGVVTPSNPDLTPEQQLRSSGRYAKLS